MGPLKGLPEKMYVEEKSFPALKALGFNLAPISGSRLLWQVLKLPEGWTLSEPTEVKGGIRNRKILDGKLRRRVIISYPSLPNPTGALWAVKRFEICISVKTGNNQSSKVAVVKDNENEIFSTFVNYKHDRHEEAAEIVAFEKAQNWLRENYPDWENPLAYWED